MDDGAGADVRTRHGAANRLDAFVDAAFAFAVSLLIIAGGEPLRSYDDLVRALMRIPAFLAGFALIILFWLAHRAWAALEPNWPIFAGVTCASWRHTHMYANANTE